MADDAVVGILRTMLTMDAAQFVSGSKQALAAEKALETGTASLGKEVAKLTPQAERMVKAFSGDKLLYSANGLVSAITKIGGATKLTESEQARANRTLADAIAKYTLMGQVAPKAMVDLEQATRKATQATGAMAAGMSAAARQSASSINLIGGMSQAGREAAASLTAVEKPASMLTTRMVALGAAAGLFFSNLAFQGIRSLVNFGRQAMDTAGRITDLADKTGLSTTTIQRLQFVADQTGTSLDSMTSAAFRLGVQIAGGSTSVESAVGKLGLSFAAIQQMRPDQQFETILDALSKMENQQERNRIGVQLFGRQFGEIAAAVEQGYQKMADAASVSSESQLRALDRAGDRWSQFVSNTKTNVTAFLGQIVLMSDAMDEIEAEAAKRLQGPRITGRPDAPRDAQGLQVQELEKRAEALRRIQLGLVGGRKEDIVLTEAQAKAAETYAQQLAAVQKELAGLTSAQRREIEAAQTLGVSNDELEAKYGLTEGALRILSASTKDYAKTAKDSAEEAKKAAEAQKAWLASIGDLVPVFSRWIQVGNDANKTVKDSMALYTAMPAAITSAADSIEGRLIPAAHGLAAAFEATDRAKAGVDELMEGGFLSAPSVIKSDDASGEARQIARSKLDEQLKEQRDQIVAFWQRQAGAIESASIGRLGTLFFGQLGHDVTGELKSAADEAELDFLRIQRSGKATAHELETAFTRWQESLDRANLDFGERFKGWMGGLQQTFVSILDDMLQYFTRNFIGGLIKGLSSAKLAQGLGNMLAGGGAGAVLGGGASFAASSVAGVEAAATGGAGASGGLMALATNPWTIGAAGAVALGMAIWKGGLFRGGEEGTKVSPRRDKFFGQLQAMFGGTQYEAAVKATQKAKIPGNVASNLIGAIYKADTQKEYDPAQFALLSALTAGGVKNVKPYNMGGFVPPGVVQPAILHGGAFGEDIVPRKSASGGQAVNIHQAYTVNINQQGSSERDWDKTLERLQWEFRLNQRGTVTVLEKALAR